MSNEKSYQATHHFNGLGNDDGLFEVLICFTMQKYENAI